MVLPPEVLSVRRVTRLELDNLSQEIHPDVIQSA